MHKTNYLYACMPQLKYILMFDIVDTAFSHERELLISAGFLQEEKEVALHVICNAHTAFLLCGAAI